MIISRLILAGISFRLSEDGKILAGPREKVTSELAALITANREHLIARIREEEEDRAARAELERVYPDHTVMSYGAVAPDSSTVAVRLWRKDSDNLADMIEVYCDLTRTAGGGESRYCAVPIRSKRRQGEARIPTDQIATQEVQEKTTKKRKKTTKKEEYTRDNNSAVNTFWLDQGT